MKVITAVSKMMAKDIHARAELGVNKHSLLKTRQSTNSDQGESQYKKTYKEIKD